MGLNRSPRTTTWLVAMTFDFDFCIIPNVYATFSLLLLIITLPSSHPLNIILCSIHGQIEIRILRKGDVHHR